MEHSTKQEPGEQLFSHLAGKTSSFMMISASATEQYLVAYTIPKESMSTTGELPDRWQSLRKALKEVCVHSNEK